MGPGRASAGRWCARCNPGVRLSRDWGRGLPITWAVVIGGRRWRPGEGWGVSRLVWTLVWGLEDGVRGKLKGCCAGVCRWAGRG